MHPSLFIFALPFYVVDSVEENVLVILYGNIMKMLSQDKWQITECAVSIHHMMKMMKIMKILKYKHVRKKKNHY